ncbi:MAG: alanine--glyoxylate aminotransferase family protein [Rhodospirillales bacterium]|jgi:alanine-glyoxylate transaminase / serine-glyoxylate transaminase / serine-pyruvate transaminase|nr:alanine--glyoxylate aminotransferase family protein [Rhodospirillales bacterium]MBT4038751.1 alanine--glyoxylate aminotransferase family protein [Rhodospirillales bacterium]MBT4627342.1 alanine--glyoxylate aminotransferase family protein [Rhodospirillales bacterium]MBT5351106.1 alanine--glyoxylate aminotransferase family protein [Rhodospirillales bacterium]MBT5521606.1 alanine--glyoxylate aminotransferase family protein [Rhodospirillales bacterium]
MTIFPALVIPDTLAAGPGPGNTDPRVLAAYAASGVADHMQADVVRGMLEIKLMLRDMFGTENAYTYGVAGTGFSGLDCMLSILLPGDSVVVFQNGTFSGIDAQTIRMKAASAEDLAANPMQPIPANVTIIDVPHGTSVSGDMVDAALAEHKPTFAFMAHWETGSGRINDIKGFNDACEKHGAHGLVDAVSSLGIEDFSIDDFPAVIGWASCPQKGVLGLPLSYAPVSFTDTYIGIVLERGCRTYVHHPVLSARHWGVIDGKDTDTPGYHQTHSCYAVASFHEALRISLTHGRAQKAADYAFHEAILRDAVASMGCKVTSNMTSLVVLDLPDALGGREKELVQGCRAEGFAIWPTLSEPVQVRIGILNQLSEEAITDIVGRFADAMIKMGANDLDKAAILAEVKKRFAAA